MVAKSFLWNQVRRMASAITGVVSGEYDLEFLAKSIENPNIPVDMGMGSPRGLILWEINHSALDGIGNLSPILEYSQSHHLHSGGIRIGWVWCNLEMSTLVNSEWIREIGLS